MSLTVFKFGGTSVGSAASIRAVARLIQREAPGQDLVVVVSAMNGVTDQILEALACARSGQPTRAAALLGQIRSRHRAAAEELFSVDRGEHPVALLQGAFAQLSAYVGATPPNEVSALESADAALSMGEELSALLLAAYLRSLGSAALFCDSAGFLITNDRFGDALPNMEATAARCTSTLLPLLERRSIPVVTGYRGATLHRQRTTLGRGGSDYSATILAAALQADQVVIWTDVDGVLSADPRLCAHTSLFHALTYAEAVELSHYGAKVIHHRAIQPARDAGIPVHIRNSRHPERDGTSISRDVPLHAPLAAVTAIAEAWLITLTAQNDQSFAVLEPLLVARAQAESVELLLSYSESSSRSASFLLRKTDTRLFVQLLTPEVRNLLRPHDAVEHDVALVTAIHRTRAASGFHSLLRRAHLPVTRTIPHPAHTRTSFVVDQKQMVAVVRRVHEMLHSLPESAALSHHPGSRSSAMLQPLSD